jgi:ABC-2 type transport system ATP-binding protein
MAEHEPSALQLSAVTVRRGARTVLDDVTLDVARGEILAIVGPNGAGKTTLLEAVLGTFALERGRIALDGAPLRTFGQRARAFAYVSAEGEPAAEDQVARIVRSAARSADPAWVEEVRTRLGIDGRLNRAAAALSRGERRRLLLFQALTADKPFVLLDEPTGVFDPLQLGEVVTLLRAAAARGSALLLSVHQLSDAEALATRVAILQRGRVLSVGTLEALREQARLGPRASLQEVFLTLLRALPEPAHARA